MSESQGVRPGPASSASRHRKRAVEFEHSKQFDKALSSYVRAIEDAEADGEEVDVGLYNKVGDLTLRQGRVADAVAYYEKAVERYATAGLFNNAIALCNKILRNAPSRSSVYLTLGRISAKKGFRGEASRNFLEYASRMQAENRTDEAMRALAEVAEMLPELSDIRALVDEYSERAGISISRRDTTADHPAVGEHSTTAHDLVFLDIGFELPEERRDPSRSGLGSSRPTPSGRPDGYGLSIAGLSEPSAEDNEPDESAIEAALHEVQSSQEVYEPDSFSGPLRLNPHDFILPGELPPLVVLDGIFPLAVAEVTDGDAISVQDTEFAEIPEPPENANAAALRRHDVLAALLDEDPGNWALRNRVGEALLEIGERSRGIEELEATLAGFMGAGDFLAAKDVAEQLVHLDQDSVTYHQRRVELAVRLGEPHRVRSTYLDLADALVRIGENARAHAVYARVLELDPLDQRARVALGPAAPPPPPLADDDYVDLAKWLREEGDTSSRLRLQEPTITGDEQADFEAILRHFKEGVALSIGEDDHDSHYDLGVAYKSMGLLDDAVAEFQKALRSRIHRLASFEALGQCFVEQGRHQVAITVLSRALHEPGLDDRQRIGVIYLLGYSCEALQRTDDARGYFERVFRTDSNFRDTAAKLAALDHITR